MKYKWGLLLCLLVVCRLGYGQYIVKGVVLDAKGLFPLPGATVLFGSQGQTTDSNGAFEWNADVPDFKLSVRFVGYITKEIPIVFQSGSQELILEILLSESENILQTMTVTAGRYERKLSEATVSLEVIRPRLIENTNTVAIDQVLQKMPGVDIIGGQPNIRGGSGFSYGAGTRVLLLLDDIPALQADAGFPNWNDFPVENIAQIEILKGASSVLYGSSALNGIVNVLTGYATDQPITKFSTFYTHFMDPADLNKKWWNRSPYEIGASFLHKQKVDKLDMVFNGFFRKNESFNESTFDEYFRWSTNLRYRFSDRLIVGVNSNFNPGRGSDFFYWLNSEDGAYRAAPGVINESNRFRFNIDPYLTYFDHQGGRHKLLSRYYYVNNNNSDNRSNQSNLFYGEYQYFKNIESWDLNVNSGAVFTQSNVNAELYGDTTYAANNVAVYTQLEKTFWKRWTVSAGARYEYNVMFSPDQIPGFQIPGGQLEESKPVFRLGSNLRIASFTHLRASYGEGYRFPTVAERFINTPLGPVSIFPNPGLTSETGWTAELGLKQGLQLGGWKGFLDVAGFVQEYDNMMEFVATINEQFQFGFQSQNIGDTRIAGIDANINGAGHIGTWYTTLLTGYTYIDPRYRNFTEQDSLSSSAKRNILKYRFQHTFKIDAETGTDKWRLGLSVQTYSNMDNIDAILEELVVPGLKVYRAENNRGFTVVDVRASYQIIKPLKISLLLKNALNREYAIRPGLLEAPRNITLRLDYDLQGG